jgi:hypothetical protein
MTESDNYHDGTFTRWIAAFSAATYAAHAIPPIDAEIAEKSHLWTEINLTRHELTNNHTFADTLSSTCILRLFRQLSSLISA